MQPLAIDLYAGLGGWTEGLLAEGYRVVGFDIERHRYPSRKFVNPDEASKAMGGKNKNGTTLIAAAREQVHGFHRAELTGGWAEYPAQLVLQDVLTIHGSQLKSASLIVASPPCQEYSYMAMPWSIAKQKAREYRDGTRDVKQLTALFDACFRIQREASEAKGEYIPLVVENVRGAQQWVGRARWHFGSFYLWGDVPALMPITKKAIKGHGGAWFKDSATADGKYGPGNFRNGVDGRSVEEDLVMTGDGPVLFECAGEFDAEGFKNTDGSWFNIGSPGQKETGRNPVHELSGVKVPTDRMCDCGHRESEHGINGFDINLPCSQCSCINPVWGSSRRTDVGNGARFTSRDCGVEATGIKQGGDWFNDTEPSISRKTGSKSPARKAASAMIAKIPLVLARHIAKAWYPEP